MLRFHKVLILQTFLGAPMCSTSLHEAYLNLKYFGCDWFAKNKKSKCACFKRNSLTLTNNLLNLFLMMNVYIITV